MDVTFLKWCNRDPFFKASKGVENQHVFDIYRTALENPWILELYYSFFFFFLSYVFWHYRRLSPIPPFLTPSRTEKYFVFVTGPFVLTCLANCCEFYLSQKKKGEGKRRKKRTKAMVFQPPCNICTSLKGKPSIMSQVREKIKRCRPILRNHNWER